MSVILILSLPWIWAKIYLSNSSCWKHGMVWKGGTKAVRCTKQLFQAEGAMEEREGGGGDGHLLDFLLLFSLIRNGRCMWRLVGCDVD